MSQEMNTVWLEDVLHEVDGAKVRQKKSRRVRVDIAPEALVTLLQLLKGKAGYLHLSAISCVDWPETSEFELVYHLWSYETKIRRRYYWYHEIL